LASFILDVSRLPIVLPMNLDVSPDTAHLIVGQGVFFSPLNIAVRNVGDGTISWSAVSTQGWLSLSAMNGFTPSNIGIRINSSDLPPGTYSGSIEIFGNDALNSPQSIDVTIIVLEYSIFLPLISR